ncbi:uncharacterized protein LOC103310661 [Acyrthosiphon pisum]|uniref:ATP-dependent DNA helicase n=1 Tax=Acyrthosiphon pisum TaxID=7029 RepID=A0A8R2FDU8_ACYPI|nr:uncharacterized protein LOC103310661 [Acyrthosiphon pisum]|eukprot:XP_008187889.1 PREDICTED: uncharacterized protein LOC103310661 [Acyrthosiphon pisum]
MSNTTERAVCCHTFILSAIGTIKLWDNFKDDLCEDIRHRIRQQNQDLALPYSEDIYNEGLIQMENKLLQLNDKNPNHFGLPFSVGTENNATYTMADHYNTNDLTSFVNENLTKLVPDQKHAFETIVDSVNNNKGKMFFMDAPSGTGKTFLSNLILVKIRQSGKIAIAVASSGIAATLLNYGKTAHSTFKLPLSVNLEQQSTCSIHKNGPLGKLLQDALLIMWDECTMSHRTEP